MRLGLCCLFRDEPITFRTTTATSLGKLPRTAQLEKLATIITHNASSLLATIDYCGRHNIGCFRINSQILPLKTHPKLTYQLPDLPGHKVIAEIFSECKLAAERLEIRLCFHPDQFVVLNSQRENVVRSSLIELEYQAEVAEWIGADVINIHAGGVYGDKPLAIEAWHAGFARLSPRVQQRLTVENDDKSYTPEDLLPLCHRAGIPLVYDVHHHRCLPDRYTIEEATELAMKTWNREPLFHISSPREGWKGPQPSRHHDFIRASDFPDCWLGRDITVEVEAKAKEQAVLRLQRNLLKRTAVKPEIKSLKKQKTQKHPK